MEHEELQLNDAGDGFVVLSYRSFDEVAKAQDLDHVAALQVSNLYGYIFLSLKDGKWF